VRIRHSTLSRTRTGSMTDWALGARLLASRDSGLPPAPRLPRSRLTLRRRTISERALTDSHGQTGTLLTLFAVRSRRHSYHSQADSAVPIPSPAPRARNRFSGKELLHCVKAAGNQCADFRRDPLWLRQLKLTRSMELIRLISVKAARIGQAKCRKTL
jgi:hypothetical protein